MELLFSILFFLIGMFLLILGANFLVSGASSLAKRLSVSELVIGLTVVAFGTSSPELIVNIFSTLSGYDEIVFGNIIGSNIFNILVILGVSGLVYPLSVHSNTVWKEIPFSLVVTILLFLMANDVLIFGSVKNELSFLDGVIFLVLFIIFIIYVFGLSKIKSSNSFEVKVYSPIMTIILILLGIVGLFIGAKLAVDNAVYIARELLVSEKLIAITLVAGGTSLPELATSVVAAFKKRSDIAIGNIVGSNIFNILFILGISSIIRTINYNPILNIDIYVIIFGSLFLFMSMFTGKVHKLDRWESLLFVLIYIGYLIYILIRR